MKPLAILPRCFRNHALASKIAEAASIVTRESENGRTCAAQVMAKSGKGVARLRGGGDCRSAADVAPAAGAEAQIFFEQYLDPNGPATR